jgi:hypothetical protein
MKYAVVYMKPKKKKLVMEQAVFYNLDDAAMWEQHINNLRLKLFLYLKHEQRI